MRAYTIVITCHNGAQALIDGLYRSDFDAIDSALERFPDAKHIFPRRLS